MTHRPISTDEDPFLVAFLCALSGAEGDDEGASNGAAGQGTDSVTANTGQDGSDADDEDEGDEDEGAKSKDERTYSAKYVKRLKDEAKRARLEKEAAETKIKNALGDKDDDKGKGDETAALKAALRKQALEHAVTIEAIALGFADPGDAYALVDTSEIDTNEETHEADRDDIKAALKTLLKSKPYLAKGQGKNVGDGDGGARGGTPKPQTYATLVEAKKKELVNSGAYVSITR